MEPINVLIVESEVCIRRRLRDLLTERHDVELVGECGNGSDARSSIRAERPELVVMDVELPDMTGLDVLAAVGGNDLPVVVFMASSEHYAIEAFDVRAVDYLLKPFTDERFERALEEARTRIMHARLGALSDRLISLLDGLQGTESVRTTSGSSYLQRLAVHADGAVKVVKVQDIDFIEGAGVYVKLHAGGTAHLHRETLSNLEERLDPSQFVRIHRSTIVNLDRVRELKPYFHGEYIVYLTTGHELKLSRSRRDKLDVLLGRSL